MLLSQLGGIVQAGGVKQGAFLIGKANCEKPVMPVFFPEEPRQGPQSGRRKRRSGTETWVGRPPGRPPQCTGWTRNQLSRDSRGTFLFHLPRQFFVTLCTVLLPPTQTKTSNTRSALCPMCPWHGAPTPLTCMC